MGYSQEFQNRINNEDVNGVLQLWEEYSSGDQVDPSELCEVLTLFKTSCVAVPFGEYAETILPLWEIIEDDDAKHEVLKLALDLQTTNTPALAALTYDHLKARYGDHKFFNEKIRLIGLRSREQFQGAITNYELLTHLNEGKYVFHTAGWGTGEIIDISLVREELALEFENVLGKKDLSFENAFNNLISLENDHFLARRFGNPDKLEQEARANPMEIIRLLLKDLGPKSAAEIKEELNELVIPAEDWTKWWQGARTKIKKDTMIDSPPNVKSPFKLLTAEVSHQERFQQALTNAKSTNALLLTIYNFSRDFPETLKNSEFKDSLKERLLQLLPQESTSPSQKFQIYIFLENIFHSKEESGLMPFSEFVQSLENIEETIKNIEIISSKKRALIALKEHREDWSQIFLTLLLSIQQSLLRDYLLKELNQEATADRLKEQLTRLVESPTLYPETFVWYFQKVVNSPSSLPYSDFPEKYTLFEAFLILYHYLEQDVEFRDLIKKMYALLSSERYASVRMIFKDSTIEYAREVLLLVTKCATLSNHDSKILHSLAEVVHPSLSTKDKTEAATEAEEGIIWTTQEGFTKIQERIHHIGTVETVENAKEIEEARALGDLKENSEYKYALEKRSRLQAELKLLTEQLNKARILTKEDIHPEEIGVGVVVHLETSGGETKNFTILGPWDADPDNNILSFQSKFAKTMEGLKSDDNFSFQDEEYTVKAVESFLART